MRSRTCILALAAASIAAAQAAETPPATVDDLVGGHCSACHNAGLASGGLDLNALLATGLDAATVDRWDLVRRKLESGAMPPPGASRPPLQEARAVTRWIRSATDRVDERARPDPGRVTARRLNRTEYNNSVRDLLGLDLRPADGFPPDDSGFGFDNVADALSLSPVQMEKYLLAAERLVRRALLGPPAVNPTVVRHQPPPRWGIDGGNNERFLHQLPYTIQDYDLTGLSHPSALHTSHFFPVSAIYSFRISPEGNRPRPSDPFEAVVWIDGRPAASVELVASASPTGMEGEDRHIRLWVDAGWRDIALAVPRIYEGLPARYGGLRPTAKPQPAPGEDGWTRRMERPALITDVRFRFNYLEISGPFEADGRPDRQVLEKILVCGEVEGDHAQSCKRRILAAFARRAFRRPPTPTEVDRLLALADRARPDSFTESLAAGLQAILVSPSFLFRIERDPAPGEERRLDDFELATRLSYFLWSTTPDERLLQAAEDGALSEPSGMEAAVTRMLRDPRIGELVRNFGGQWLQFRALESVRPDRDRYARFDAYLRRSMERETEIFFERIVRDDRSILEFLDGRYTYLNENLARFYGIDGVSGPEFRRVDLSGTPRGGVLTHASVLTVSSYPTRTSPVLRGKWILDNLLGDPPASPPGDVPAIDEEAGGAAASLRDQLERHRSDPNCASCHARMDPLGFALENFDAIGRWRARDGEFEIDATGQLPDGRSIDGPADLLAILGQSGDRFVRALTEKLMVYALGRGLDAGDRVAARRIARRVRENDYRFSSLVLGIVESAPFQRRRAPREGT